MASGTRRGDQTPDATDQTVRFNPDYKKTPIKLRSGLRAALPGSPIRHVSKTPSAPNVAVFVSVVRSPASVAAVPRRLDECLAAGWVYTDAGIRGRRHDGCSLRGRRFEALRSGSVVPRIAPGACVVTGVVGLRRRRRLVCDRRRRKQMVRRSRMAQERGARPGYGDGICGVLRVIGVVFHVGGIRDRRLE